MRSAIKFTLLLFLLFSLSCNLDFAGKKAENFSLENWDGQTVTMDNLKGKPVVLAFSYAYCSVRCPVVTIRMLSLDDYLGAPDNIVYLHVGVDPENDTAENRKKYFGLYRIDPEKDRRWYFVSGNTDELSKVWRSYGIDIEKVTSEWLPEGYYMEFTPKVFLIDTRGKVKHETDVDFEEEDLGKRVKMYL